MRHMHTDSLELERQFAEAIDNLFDIARKYDFTGAERVTYLARTWVDKKLFGFRWRACQEKLTSSFAYHLHEGESDFDNGLLLAVEGIFIQMPPAYTSKWPFSTKRPQATESLIREINITASRIAS